MGAAEAALQLCLLCVEHDAEEDGLFERLQVEEARTELHLRRFLVMPRRELQERSIQPRLKGKCVRLPAALAILVQEEVVAPDIVHDRSIMVVRILTAEDVDLPVVVDDIDNSPHEDPKLADHPRCHTDLGPIALVVGRGRL